jgi:uncharacterized protein (TIGR03545 family)
MNKGRRLFFFGVLLAVVAFNIFFKDQLLTRAAEKGLEALFGAQADIRGLRFQPLRGSITLAALAVTDADEPTRNLFELGGTGIEVNLNQLLRRRFVLEEAACRELRFGTERPRPGRVSAPRGGSEDSPRRAAAAPLREAGLSSAAELVEKHYALLKSPGRLEALRRSLEGGRSAWDARRRGLEEEVAAAAAAAGELLALRADTLEDPAAVADALQKLALAREKLAGAGAAVARAGADIARDRQQAEAALAAVSDSLAADRRTLLALWELPASETGGLSAFLLQRLLEPLLGGFSRHAVRAVEAAAALQGEKSRDGALRRRGRELDFPLQRYPRFLLRRLTVSWQDADDLLQVELGDISSDMELWGRPAWVSASRTGPGKTRSLAGTLDLRREAAQLLALTVTSSSERTRIALEGWPPLVGRHELESALAVDRERRVTGSLRIRASVRAGTAGPADPAARVVMKALDSLDEVIIQGRFGALPGNRQPAGGLHLEITSNLAEELARGAAAEAAAMGRELEQALAARLAEEEAETRRLVAALREEGLRLEEERGRLALLEDALEKQKKAIGGRLPGGVLPEVLKRIKLPGT